MLKRHTNCSSFRQLTVQTLHIAFTRVEHDAESPRGFIRMRCRIGALQLGVADGQCSVGELPAPFRRCILCHRRVAPGELESDLAVQATFIGAKDGIAPAVKLKINTGTYLQ